MQKNFKILSFIILAALIVSASLVWAVETKKKLKEPVKDPNGISWYDYEAGWQKAKAENKHMFVDFTATWCGWCKRLEAGTFSDPKVIAALTNDFVPVKVWEKNPDTLDLDGYKIASEDLRIREFGATSFPMLWFVSPKAVRVGPVRGYVDAPTLLQFFDVVKYYRYDSTLDESGKPKVETKP
jgi:thiol:disulfide interchange protein